VKQGSRGDRQLLRLLDDFSGTRPGLGGGFGWSFSASSATLREAFQENSMVLARMPVGLVPNFGLERSKDGITRIVNGLPD
jgi:hypothetical protein